MNIQAPYLQPGDTIGITCPAGAVNLDEINYMFDQLRGWGFKIKIGTTVGSSYHKFSANDDERCSDFQQMLDDDEVKAILFGRGGYGVVRIIDRIDFTKFKNNPKWLLGYSDITCIHSHLQSVLGICSIHAHMCGGYLPNARDNYSTESIFNVLRGEPIDYHLQVNEMNRLGVATGVLCGGNLALLSDLVGTKSDLDTKGKILFIEDIAEQKYNIDRMLWQLLRAGKLDQLAALVVGGFTDTQDNEIPFGMTEYEMVWEKVRSFNYPVCFDFPVGHQPLNYALVLGQEYKLSVNREGVHLGEIRNI